MGNFPCVLANLEISCNPNLLCMHAFNVYIYTYQASVLWAVQGLLSVQVECDTFNVTPKQPGVVEDVSITLQHGFPSCSQYFSQYIVLLQYIWTEPAFKAEGVTGYQVWLNTMQAPTLYITNQRLQQLSPNSSSGETQTLFTSDTSSLVLYFQVSIRIGIIFEQQLDNSQLSLF